MTSLADRIAGLSPEQRALLERRLRERSATLPDVPSAPVDGPSPLSPAQQRLWFLDRMEPDSPAYTIPVAHRLRGPLDVRAMERALTDVVGRHDALRAWFDETPNGVVQRTRPHEPVPLPVRDVHGEPDREAAGLALLAEQARRPFDLAAGPLVRALLVRLAPDDHLFLLTVHHIVFDGWSRSIVVEELAERYAHHAGRDARALPPLPARYADYAALQVERLRSGAMEADLAYWRAHLAALPPLDLPADRRPPAVRTHAGGSVTFSVSPRLVAAAEAFGRDRRATLFMVLLAAFEALLHRYSGQEDFAVGMPVAGRSRPAFERLVGFFVDTVVARADLSGAPSFGALVERVREEILGALAHQEAPFERVVQEVQAGRHQDRTAVVQAVFGVQNVPASPLALSGIEATPVHVETGTAKFDVQLLLTPEGGGLGGRLTYSTDLFDEATAGRLAAHYATLLAGLLADPDREVAAVPLLTPAERRQQHAWNAPATADRDGGSLPDLFRAQAARAPSHVALEDGERTWTYAEADAWSDRLAARLRQGGVGPGMRVGILAARSAEFVAGVLAVVKAGAAYVPLDPAYPAERLAFMADDAALAALLVQPGLRDAPAVPLAFTLDDAPGPGFGSGGVAAHAAGEGAPSAAACVLYTSGSTGRPKGVVLPHRAVVHLVRGADYVDLGPDDRVAHLASPSFDAATFEIWGALLAGARLVIIPQATVLDPPRLAATFRARGVSTAFLTTSLFNLVVREAPEAFATLRTVLFGGEPADPHAVRAALAAPPRRLINAYGPTETTTFAAWHLVTDVPDEATSVPIGKPILGAALWVLDGRGAPVPVGVPGELHIGGTGVATGYLRRPDLTAERFVPDPFSSVPGARLYRTGDLARRLPDGTLDFLGRADRQVKLRGFRIEPGEIEARLRAHAAIADAVVTVQGEAGGRRLVAFIVPAPGASPDPASVRADLRRVLPEHLVPSAIGVLAALPLTANGKADTRALPVLGATPEPAETDAECYTEAELHLADVWREVLGTYPASRDDDFFDLGGHSLLALQMLSAVRRTFGQAPPLSAIFDAPTLRTFALRVQSAVLESARSHVFSMGGDGAGEPVLFVHGVEAHCLPFVKLARLLGSDRPVYGTQGLGLDGGLVRHGSVEEIARAYAAEWARVSPGGRVHLVGLCYGATLALEIGRQLEARGADVGSVMAINQPFLPSERRRPRLNHYAQAVRRRASRVVQRGLFSLSRHLEARGRSLDGLRRRIGYVDRALVLEATRRPVPEAFPTRQAFLERHYDAIVEDDREGTGSFTPADVRDALGLYQRWTVTSIYRRMIEAYRGGSFGGRLVLLQSDAHAEDPISARLARLVGRIERRRVPGPHSPLYEPFVHDLAAEMRRVLGGPGER